VTTLQQPRTTRELIQYDLAWINFRKGRFTPLTCGWTYILRIALKRHAYRAVILFRLAHQARVRGRRLREWIWQGLLFHTCGAEISSTAEIGPGLALPHPQGVIVSHGARLGAFVTIGQHATIGGNIERRDEQGGKFPTIGDGVMVMANSVVAGPVKIGDGSMIGANSVVIHDIPPQSLAGGTPARVIREVDPKTVGFQAARTLFGDAPAAVDATGDADRESEGGA
jgi:serine O-acetyltransferase